MINRRLALLGGAGAIAAWWGTRRPFRVAVEGASMEPTLSPGEYLVAVRRPVRLGDLVVVEHPARPGFELIKRVTGLPGDVVAGVTIEAGQCWIVGDRADATTDSSTFGPVSVERIRGVVRLRYWPPERLRLFR